MKSTRAAAVAALLMFAPVAMSQQDNPKAPPPPQPADAAVPGAPVPVGAKPAPAPPPPPPAKDSGLMKPIPVAINPPFARLAEMGADGKIKRVDGILDVLAIQRNKLVDEATREKIRPMVQAWMADVDQLAIDNLDFLEKIEPSDGGPGVIDTVDIQDMKKIHYVAEMMTQLMSTGPLSSHLETKEGFTRDQSSLNQQIVSDYLQQVMNEIMAASGAPNDLTAQQNLPEDVKVKQVNAVSRFLYYISCRDTMDSFHRQLEAACPLMDRVVKAMDLSAAENLRVATGLAQCAGAKDKLEKRRASRAALDALTFDHQREALTRARELSPGYDPVAELGPPIPPPPDAGQPVQPAAQPAVYKPQPTTPADSDKGGGN